MVLKRTSHAGYDTRYHLVWAPPKYAIGILKSMSASRLFAQYPELKAEWWREEFWGTGTLCGRWANK